MTKHELDRIAFASIEAIRQRTQKNSYLVAYNDGVVDFLSVLYAFLAAEEG